MQCVWRGGLISTHGDCWQLQKMQCKEMGAGIAMHAWTWTCSNQAPQSVPGAAAAAFVSSGRSVVLSVGEWWWVVPLGACGMWYRGGFVQCTSAESVEPRRGVVHCVSWRESCVKVWGGVDRLGSIVQCMVGVHQAVAMACETGGVMCVTQMV
jgi:hypothetical protein